MLVKIMYSHWPNESFVNENTFETNGMKYMLKIKPINKTKLKLKNLFFKIFVLKIERSVLQFIAWMICIKQIVRNDIVLAATFPNLLFAITNITRTTSVWMNPSYKMLVPIFPDKRDFWGFRGGLFIMSFSAGSMPKAKAGSESVTKFINNIWAGSRNIAFGIISDVTKIPRTSTRFVEIKNKIVFVMLL